MKKSELWWSAMANSVASLDLYARVETLLHNEEAISSLYGSYLKVMDGLTFDTVLDVGCGSGGFLTLLEKVFSPSQLKGIDLSPVMVARARDRGMDAEAINLCEMKGQYDVITAVFDMVNYLDKQTLSSFMQCVAARLTPGGYFICDINTEYGFDEIASGSFTAEDESQYLVIDSIYEKGIYRSDFTCFEKRGTLYHREDEQIVQYFHTVEELTSAGDLTLLSHIPLILYGEESDKWLVVMQKGVANEI